MIVATVKGYDGNKDVREASESRRVVRGGAVRTVYSSLSRELNAPGK